jgi:hypothetical protein
MTEQAMRINLQNTTKNRIKTGSGPYPAVAFRHKFNS